MKRTAFILLCAVAACKSGQPVVKPAETQVDQEATRPDWVRSRPVSDDYYIGIGLCPKSRSDYQETAKQNALHDLSSEISVTVEGNSLLYTLDQRSSFHESYTSTVRTRSSEQLEGFELVDTWENANEQWIYYRLGKADWARIIADRKQKAIDQATDLYTRAAQSIAQGDLKNAFDQYLRALIAMKDYWGGNDQVTIEGKQVSLANDIYANLQNLTTGVRISALPERCALNYANRFKREMLITASFTDGKKTRDLAQLPLLMSYEGRDGKTSESKNTDTDGHTTIAVQHAALSTDAAELLVRLDMDHLVSPDLDPAFTKPLLGSLTIPETRVPIGRDMPRVFAQALESNMGQPVTDAGVAPGLREEMTTHGFRFTDSPADADLLMNVNSATREGGQADGFFTAYLDVSFTFRDRRTNEIIYQGGKQSVKGVQLTFAKAGMAAFGKASQDLRGDLVDALMNALL